MQNWFVFQSKNWTSISLTIHKWSRIFIFFSLKFSLQLFQRLLQKLLCTIEITSYFNFETFLALSLWENWCFHKHDTCDGCTFMFELESFLEPGQISPVISGMASTGLVIGILPHSLIDFVITLIKSFMPMIKKVSF